MKALIRHGAVAACTWIGLASAASLASAQVPGFVDFNPPPPATGTATYTCQPGGGTFTARFIPLSLTACDPRPAPPRVSASCDAAGRATPTITVVACGTVRIVQAPKGSTITVDTGLHATVEVRTSNVTVIINQDPHQPNPDVIIRDASSVTVKFTGHGIGTLTFDNAKKCDVTATGGGRPTDLNPPVGSIEEVKFTKDSDDNKVKSDGDQPTASEDSNSSGNHVNGKKYPFEKKSKKE